MNTWFISIAVLNPVFAYSFQEVMDEIDDDQSHTLDFFEFVKVAVILLKKTGNV